MEVLVVRPQNLAISQIMQEVTKTPNILTDV